jgi:GTP cyclohydrolase I
MAEKGQESRPSLSKTNEETISSPRGNTWGYEETVSLLEVWAEDTMQRDLENTPKRNMDTYKKIVEQINA